MMPKLLTLLALATASTAFSLPRDESSKGFMTFPVSKARSGKKLVRRDVPDVTLYNVSSISYLIELSIGTPGQKTKVAIDTGSDELWVNPQCSTASTQSQAAECENNGEYNPEDSSTAAFYNQDSQITYGKGKVKIEYVMDSIALPGSDTTVSNATFGVAISSSDLNEGILGLGFGNGSNLQYNNFIDELAAQGITKSKAFAVALGSELEDNAGVITFGGYDTKKFTGKFETLEILQPNRNDIFRYWVQLDKVGVTQPGSSNSKTLTSDGMQVVLDTGSTLSYMPAEVVDAIAEDFDAEFDSESGAYLLKDCSVENKDGSVDFTFGSKTIKVPYREFIWKETVSGQDFCLLGVLAMDSSSGITALLGDSFLRAAYTVFDQDSGSVFMAQYANCGENEKEIPAGNNGIANAQGECKEGDLQTSSSSSSGNGDDDSAGHAVTGSLTTVFLAVAFAAGANLFLNVL